VLIEGIVVAVVVAALAAAFFTRRLSHDDEHSVDGYHRSLHTLEHINEHPTVSSVDAGSGHGVKAAYPESAVRLAGTPTVRVTDLRVPSVPPVPPPSTVDPDVAVSFDDAGPPSGNPPPVVASRDKAMSSINHRPRRLAAPALAVAAVIVLIIVLLVTGSHTVPPVHHHSVPPAGGRSNSSGPKSHRTKEAETTSTTQPPPVSLPQASTSRGATYEVSDRDFTLALSATSGACWVDATSTASGSTLFTGTLQAGERQAFEATGPVTLIIGAQTVLVASVDGITVALPSGFQTPFTMSFVTADPPTT